MTASLPLPIARLLGVAALSAEAKTRFDKVYEAWEASIRLTVSAYPPADPATLKRPSLGQWAGAHPARTRALDAPELIDVLRHLSQCGTGRQRNARTTTGNELVSLIPAYRNAMIGHGASRPDAKFYAEPASILDVGVRAAWRLGIFWAVGAELVFVDKVFVDACGQRHATVHVMMGPTPLRRELEMGEDLVPGRLYRLEQGRGYPLYPWLLHGGSLFDVRTLFFNGTKNKRAEYLDYLSGELSKASTLATRSPTLERDTGAMFEPSPRVLATAEPLRGTWRVVERAPKNGRVTVCHVEHVDLPGCCGLAHIVEPGDAALDARLLSLAGWAKRTRPHVAHVEECARLSDGALLVVTERLPGQSLRARLEQGRLSPADAARILKQVGSALALAHAQGLVHGGLTPEAVWLTHDLGSVQTAEVHSFGCWTRAQDGDSEVAYAAPEQLAGEAASVSGDVYGLGALAYHCLTGQRPYAALGGPELAGAVLAGQSPTPLAEIEPSLPAGLDLVVRQAMARSPEERPESAIKLAVAIGESALWQSRPRPTFITRPTSGCTVIRQLDDFAQVLWHGLRCGPDELRFSLPRASGAPAAPAAPSEIVLAIAEEGKSYGVGRDARKNDVALQHARMSRRALVVERRGSRVYVQRHPDCSVDVVVGLCSLARGEESPLHHGQVLTVGDVAATFCDARFGPAPVRGNMVDATTGLLGKDGLVWEAKRRVRAGAPVTLLVCAPADEQRASEQTALVCTTIHEHAPEAPVGVCEGCAVCVLPSGALLTPVADSVRRVAVRGLRMGSYALTGSEDEVATAVGAAIVACGRLPCGRSDLVDLTQHLVPMCSMDEFVRQARALVRGGGGVALLALERARQLDDLGPVLRQTVETELYQLCSRLLGPGHAVTRVEGGVTAIAVAKDAETCGRQLAREWAALGPVRSGFLEVERSLACSVLEEQDVDRLQPRARELASSLSVSEGVEGLPLPIAVQLHAALETPSGERLVEALIRAVDCTWRFLGIVVGSLCAIHARRPQLALDVPPEQPWRSLALAGASAVRDLPPPVGDLIQPLFDAEGRVSRGIERATEVASRCLGRRLRQPAEPAPNLVEAARALVGALWPLRTWSLIAVDHVQPLAAFGHRVQVEYTDFTGSFPRGTPRRVTLVGDLRLGPFVYLTRLAEGTVIPLEPMCRVRLFPDESYEELCWAERPILAPGMHRFSSVVDEESMDDEVLPQHLPG